MAYRKFKADQLFDGYRLHSNDKVLITDDSGEIQSIVPVSEAGDNVQLVPNNGILPSQPSGGIIALTGWSMTPKPA